MGGIFFFFFQAEDGIRDADVTGVQTCALPICIHEGTIEQMQRLFAERLYTTEGNIPLDTEGRIRIDDWEMREDVQTEVDQLWKQVTTENIEQISDIEGYRNDFFNLFGFNYNGIDYDAETNEVVNVPSIS